MFYPTFTRARAQTHTRTHASTHQPTSKHAHTHTHTRITGACANSGCASADHRQPDLVLQWRVSSKAMLGHTRPASLTSRRLCTVGCMLMCGHCLHPIETIGLLCQGCLVTRGLLPLLGEGPARNGGVHKVENTSSEGIIGQRVINS